MQMKPDTSRESLHTLLDMILDLRDAATEDPAGKDYAARLATAYAWMLVRDSVDWALLHQIGVGLNNPNAPGEEPEQDDEWHPPSAYPSAERDDPAHEEVGRAFLRDWQSYSPKEIRGSVIAALRYVPRVVNDEVKGFAYGVLQGMEALNVGVVDEIFKPSRKSPHGNPYITFICKITAIDTVYELRGLGMTHSGAEETVADIFGQSVETIRSWRKRDLPQAYAQGSIRARWASVLRRHRGAHHSERPALISRLKEMAGYAAGLYHASISPDEQRLRQACEAFLRCTEPANVHPE